MGLVEGRVDLKKKSGESASMLLRTVTLNVLSNSHRFELSSRNLTKRFSEQVKIDLQRSIVTNASDAVRIGSRPG